LIEQQNAELSRQAAALEAANAELARLSATDLLTDLPNRRKFIEIVEEEMRLSERYGSAFTLVMFDVDRFKAVNDTFGHDVGDRVLVHVASTVRGALRATDVVARWGGEEFMAILRQADVEVGAQLAEKLRAHLASARVDPVGAVTASFGATAFRPPESFGSLSARVDGLVYRAKERGRNRVVHD